jgi:hypothetical protein
MALPSSGAISFSDLNVAIGNASNAQLDLQSASNALQASGAPYGMDELYGKTLPPTYAIAPNVTSVAEGSSVTYTITTTNVGNGTVLYWSNNGTTTNEDFTDYVNSGSLTINSNTATLVRTLNLDAVNDPNQTIIINLRSVSVTGNILATAATVTTTELTKTYSISPNVSSVDEGGVVTFTVTTAGIADGLSLSWSNVGTTAASDFSDNSNSGNVTIYSNTASFTRTLLNDISTEGEETIIIKLYDGGTEVASSASVTVNDTSLSPTYSISGSPTAQDEGSSVDFTISTTGVSNGTTLYWKIIPEPGETQPVSGDFVSGLLEGTVTINSNAASFSVQLSADESTEGEEVFVVQLRSGSQSGTFLTQSQSIFINDTSTTPAPPPPTELYYEMVACSGGASVYYYGLSSPSTNVYVTSRNVYYQWNGLPGTSVVGFTPTLTVTSYANCGAVPGA